MPIIIVPLLSFADFSNFGAEFAMSMKTKHAFAAFAALLLGLSSCTEQASVFSQLHPYVDRILSDTSSQVYRVAMKHPGDESLNAISVIGEPESVLYVAEYLANADNFDNIDGASSPDRLADFSGEIFELLLDEVNSPYLHYGRQSNSMFLREIFLRNSIDMLSHKCYANAYDSQLSQDKMPSKAIILTSMQYVPEVRRDIDTLFRAVGINVPVFTLPESAVKAVFSRYKNITGIGVMADLDVVSSGIYGDLISRESLSSGYLTAVNNVIFTPSGESAEEKIGNFLKMYVDAGYRQKLNAIIIDDPALAVQGDSMRVAISRLIEQSGEEGQLYDMVLADDFTFINPLETVSDELFTKLRSLGRMALRISGPQFSAFITVPAPSAQTHKHISSESFADSYKYNRAYNSSVETYKTVRLTRRHVDDSDLALVDSIAPTVRRSVI